ncbi:hypothetical protein Nepgr_031156 [Nepenthes gracilis]|uniref:Auxin-responsive protein n=1 Tax=Nepenthes gracilis TaxID=150966 RepID=A0AAD3TG03_NEPGR|nr:hypothetical protein Nepgr_031156 [Nepenthes gracilis]
MESACSKEVVKRDYVGPSKEAELELGLGLSLGGGGGGGGGGGVVKILTAQDFPSVVCHGSSTPSCFSATGRPLAAISGTKRTADSISQDANGSAAAVSHVVGWPPIRSYRMNNLASQTKSVNAEEGKMFVENGIDEDGAKKKINGGGKKKSPAGREVSHPGFMKVYMDGVQIGRKIDLNAHLSYETLAMTIEDMFFKPSTAINSIGGEKEQPEKLSKLLDGSSEFVLTYEDREEDWMLVGDVPWGMFLSTVKRLRIMRTSEANGLAPRFQVKSEKQRSKPI